MGAFFLTTRGSLGVDLDKAKKSFSNMGFKKHDVIQFGAYDLLLCGKISDPDAIQYVTSEKGSVFCCGTLMYKHHDRKSVLNAVLIDYCMGNLDQNELMGVFVFFIYKEGEIHIFQDNMNMYNVFYLKQTFAISSSFVCLSESLKSQLTLNLTHVYINLISGFSLGNGTTFSEIEKLEGDLPNVPYHSAFVHVAPKSPFRDYGCFSEAVMAQIEQQQEYFAGLRRFLCMDEDCVDIGLSAGFDSRLLLALAISGLQNIQLHSNAKKKPDKDLIISRILAAAVGKDLVEVKIRDSDEMTKDEMNENLKKAYYFYDGQFVVNHGWTREYRSLEYRQKVLGSCTLGMSGHNGEQYRNHNREHTYSMSLEYYIKEHIFSGNTTRFLSAEDTEHYIVDFVKKRWSDKYGISGKRIDYQHRRMLYSKELVRFGPGIRASIENKLSYYLMPFAEHKAWISAEGIGKFLGVHGRFEANMIYVLNPAISRIDTNYGFNICDIMAHDAMKDWLRVLVPLRLVNSYRHIRKGLGTCIERQQLEEVLMQMPTLRVNHLLSKGNEHICDRAVALSFLLNRFSPKVSC